MGNRSAPRILNIAHIDTEHSQYTRMDAQVLAIASAPRLTRWHIKGHIHTHTHEEDKHHSFNRLGLTRALLGLWIFHRLLGGGAFERPPPMISAPGRRREKRKAAFESSRKIISKSFRSFFGSGQNWGLQGSKFQNFPKRFFDDKIFIFKGRATILIPSCLSR